MLTYPDPVTGRTVRQLTEGDANAYPLYYFIPSHTADGRYLIIHSEATGWVQLERLDLETGERLPLTQGWTRDSGWYPWCEYHVRGIYNHLSALNPPRNQVIYFQDNPHVSPGVMQVRSVDVASRQDHLLLEMPGRMSIGQSACSPDGRHFAFIHAHHDSFRRAIADRLALASMGRSDWVDHERWRSDNPCTLAIIDLERGVYREVVALPFHVHHVIFVDSDTLLVNHVEHGNGMWIIRLDGSGRRELRPPNENGRVCHQVVTRKGIFYEAFKAYTGEHRNTIGCYDLASDSYEEFQVQPRGYMHTGFDPLGEFRFYEIAGQEHTLQYLAHEDDPDRRELVTFRTLAPYPARGQRYHAHPFMADTGNPDHDRKWVYHTAVIDGRSQICAVDVADLTHAG